MGSRSHHTVFSPSSKRSGTGIDDGAGLPAVVPVS